MEELTTQAAQEIKNATEDQLKEIMAKWFESTRTDGMKIGAKYISAAIMSTIKKHIGGNGKPSLRSYERMTKDIMKIIEVPLKSQEETETAQNNLEDNNDGTAE